MNIQIANDYDSLSRMAANDLLQLIAGKTHPLICTASGDSPAGLYRELAKRFSQQEINVKNWKIVGLDEWIGLNGNDEGSCRYHLNQQLFHPLALKDEQISFFDGRSADPGAECRKVEKFIAEAKGIAVMIAGVGMNGHVGMNEPGSKLDSRAHVQELDPITAQVGQKYFTKAQALTKGITLGLANFMESGHIFLLLSGKHKAAIAQQLIEGEISEKLPASLLKRHPLLHIYLDQDAASSLKQAN